MFLEFLTIDELKAETIKIEAEIDVICSQRMELLRQIKSINNLAERKPIWEKYSKLEDLQQEKYKEISRLRWLMDKNENEEFINKLIKIRRKQ
jgi:hypothetical protein